MAPIRGFKIIGFPPPRVAASEPPVHTVNLRVIPITDDGDLQPIPLRDSDLVSILVATAAALLRHVVDTTQPLTPGVRPHNPPRQGSADVHVQERLTDAETEERFRWDEKGLKKPPTER